MLQSPHASFRRTGTVYTMILLNCVTDSDRKQRPSLRGQRGRKLGAGCDMAQGSLGLQRTYLRSAGSCRSHLSSPFEKKLQASFTTLVHTPVSNIVLLCIKYLFLKIKK